MRKYAVFVEGQAELIFVREMLQKMYDYSNIALDCYELRDKNQNAVPYSYGDKSSSDYYYQIINVGNDNSVLSAMKKRADSLASRGFEKVVGLRDIYGETYLKQNGRRQKIDRKIIARISEKAEEIIRNENFDITVRQYYAIMEIESWFLGFDRIFETEDPRLTPQYIKDHLGYDLETIDPETYFFHPASDIEKIYDLVGKKYGKHKSEVNTLVSSLTKEDYDKLRNSGKCPSFTKFLNELLN